MAIYNVNGKKFDTEKAELVASSKMPYRDAGYDMGTGRWRKLYRTKKGNWIFVYVSCWQGSRNYAELISEEEAQKFILEYGDEEAIKKYCQDVEEV